MLNEADIQRLRMMNPFAYVWGIADLNFSDLKLPPEREASDGGFIKTVTTKPRDN